MKISLPFLKSKANKIISRSRVLYWLVNPKYRRIQFLLFRMNYIRFRLFRKRFTEEKFYPFLFGEQKITFEPTDAQLVYQSHSGPVRIKGYQRVSHYDRFPVLTRRVTLSHLYKAIDTHPDINEGVFSILVGDAATVFQDLVRKSQFIRQFNNWVIEANERNSKRKTTDAV